MNSDRFLRLRQVEDKIGFGKSWIYRQIQLWCCPLGLRRCFGWCRQRCIWLWR
ncbi:AlpA family phage regulatory protein [Enterobacter hormaechei]|nr:AlpA family phage regulatory protein [Enterobacter hormaechei]MCM7801103.1 AlpA family phage regulatory protein [Enterobacter hormaechei]MDO0900143.1 AlpA family phage regulatory protein [Enterobacter hormaechei]